MIIETYGTLERTRVAARLLGGVPGNTHFILLPVPSSRNGLTVTGTDVPLDEAVSHVGEGTLLVGYGLPERLSAIARERGGETLELSRDEKFLLENAHITAVGALGYILNLVRTVPKDTAFGVVGYGRIGSELVRMLLFLGASVRIYTSKILNRLELGECGLSTSEIFPIREPLDFSGLDVLINTAPTDMTGNFPNGIPEGLLVVELASGNNFPGIDGVVRLPSLPEKMHSESGGRAYFSAVMRHLEKEDAL